MLKTPRHPRLLTGLLALFLSLTGCDGKLDSPSSTTTGTSTPPTDDGIDLNRVTLRQENPETFTQAPQPIVTLMFSAETVDGDPVSGLQSKHLLICEGAAGGTLAPLKDNSESFAEIVPRNELSYTLKTVLSLDVSTSISPSDFNAMRAAAKALVARIEPQQQIAIHTFAGTVQEVQAFTRDVAQLNAALDALQPGGGNSTDLYGAAIRAFGQWERNYTAQSISDGYAILITDGEHNANSTPISEVDKARGSGKDMKRMFVIGVGEQVREDLLQQIVNHPQRVVALNNYAELDATLQSAYTQMQNYANSFYHLRYASTRLDSGNYQVKLVVNRSGSHCAQAGIAGTYSAAGFEPLRPALQLAPAPLLLPGKQITLQARLKWSPYPTTFRFSSSDTRVATVSSDGLPGSSSTVAINAVAQHQGEAVITVTDDAYNLSTTQTVTVGELFLEHFGDNADLLLQPGGQRVLAVRTPSAEKTPAHTWEIVDGATVIRLSANSGSQISLFALQPGSATLRISDLNNDRERLLTAIVITP